MIKSTDSDAIEYDILAQLEVLEQIKHVVVEWIPGMTDYEYDSRSDAQATMDKFKYFVREYCRTDDIPAGFDELKTRHGALCDEIEMFEL